MRLKFKLCDGSLHYRKAGGVFISAACGAFNLLSDMDLEILWNAMKCQENLSLTASGFSRRGITCDYWKTLSRNVQNADFAQSSDISSMGEAGLLSLMTGKNHTLAAERCRSQILMGWPVRSHKMFGDHWVKESLQTEYFPFTACFCLVTTKRQTLDCSFPPSHLLVFSFAPFQSLKWSINYN